MTERHQYQPGDKMLIVSPAGYNLRSYRPVTVAKVYKNGNAVLEGMDGQWRPNGSKVGSHSSVWVQSPSLHPDTPELRAEIDAERREAACRTNIHALGSELIAYRNKCPDPVAFWDGLPENLRKMVEKADDRRSETPPA